MAVTPAGAVRLALDFGEVESALRLRRAKKRYWSEIFDGLLIMETEARKAMSE